MKVNECPDELWFYVDLFASEYSWTIEYIQTLDVVEAQKLALKIKERKNRDLQRLAYAFNHALNGKMPSFDDKENDTVNGSDMSDEEFKAFFKAAGGVITKLQSKEDETKKTSN